jgi:hypothetical protein
LRATLPRAKDNDTAIRAANAHFKRGNIWTFLIARVMRTTTRLWITYLAGPGRVGARQDQPWK